MNLRGVSRTLCPCAGPLPALTLKSQASNPTPQVVPSKQVIHVEGTVTKQLDDELDEMQVHIDFVERQQARVEAALEGGGSYLWTSDHSRLSRSSRYTRHIHGHRLACSIFRCAPRLDPGGILGCLDCSSYVASLCACGAPRTASR